MLLSPVYSLIGNIHSTHTVATLFSCWRVFFVAQTKCKLYLKRLKSCKIFILLKNQFPLLSFILLVERAIKCTYTNDVVYEEICDSWTESIERICDGAHNFMWQGKWLKRHTYTLANIASKVSLNASRLSISPRWYYLFTCNQRHSIKTVMLDKEIIIKLTAHNIAEKCWKKIE